MTDYAPILAAHAQWLADPTTGQHADLSGANLSHVNLSHADLRGANLSGAYLSGADLSHADLRDADLSDAILSGANLSHANLSDADLSDADLRDAILSGADLSHADLSRADLSHADLSHAGLRGANLRGAVGLPVTTDFAERLVAAATAALAKPEALNMLSWHTCDTVHCIGGWAIHQAGPLGAVLEETHGAPIAALLLLGPEAQSHFWDSNEDAHNYLQSVLDAAKS